MTTVTNNIKNQNGGRWIYICMLRMSSSSKRKAKELNFCTEIYCSISEKENLIYFNF